MREVRMVGAENMRKRREEEEERERRGARGRGQAGPNNHETSRGQAFFFRFSHAIEPANHLYGASSRRRMCLQGIRIYWAKPHRSLQGSSADWHGYYVPLSTIAPSGKSEVAYLCVYTHLRAILGFLWPEVERRTGPSCGSRHGVAGIAGRMNALRQGDGQRLGTCSVFCHDNACPVCARRAKLTGARAGLQDVTVLGWISKSSGNLA